MLIFFFEQSDNVSSDSSSDKSASHENDSSFDQPPAKEDAVVEQDKEPEAAVKPENETAVGQAAKAAVEPPAEPVAAVEPPAEPVAAVEPPAQDDAVVETEKKPEAAVETENEPQAVPELDVAKPAAGQSGINIAWITSVEEDETAKQELDSVPVTEEEVYDWLQSTCVEKDEVQDNPLDIMESEGSIVESSEVKFFVVACITKLQG